MSFRKILFWIHFAAGSVAGIVILVMSLTGVLLAYERQVVAWVDRGFRSTVPAPGAPRMEIGVLLVGVGGDQTSPPQSETVHADPALPVEIAISRDRVLYLDAITGRKLGEGSQRVRDFFFAVESWHRWLGVGEANRPIGRAITGASNLAFLILIITGLYLWWPRGFSWQRLRIAIRPRVDLPAGRARHWNWHTVGGFWLAAPLLVIVSSGVVMSYPLATNLLYRITGNTPPPQGRGQFAAFTASPDRPRRDAPRHDSEAGRKHNGQGKPETKSEDVHRGFDSGRLHRDWALAEGQVPGWKSITEHRAPGPGGPEVFVIDRGDGGRPDLRAQLVLDSGSGEVVRWEPFSSYNLGRRSRTWLRFLHTGEAGGIPGRTLAALTAAMASLLVYTGLAMAWRRARTFFAKERPGENDVTAEAANSRAGEAPLGRETEEAECVVAGLDAADEREIR